MTVSEESVLEPKDPSIENWDDWPTYSLTNIEVLDQLTALPVSLFSAHKDHPVKVIGHLETIDDDLSHLIRDSRYKTKTIELTDITTYAFAEFDDGSHGFWAAGKAGWFEIQDPVDAFQHIFDRMNEAASIFYFMVDKLRRARKSHYTAKFVDQYATKLFKEYLCHGKNYLRRVDINDVCAAFHEHCEFLITSMLEGQEGLDWQSSAVLRYFKSKYPEHFAAIEARIYPAQVVPEPEPEGPEKDGSKRLKNGVRKGRNTKTERRPNLPNAQNPNRSEVDTERDSSLSEDEPRNGDARNHQLNSRKRKSILQPAGSKYSKKAAGRRRSVPLTDHVQAENEDRIDGVDDDSPLQENSPIPPAKNQDVHLGAYTRASLPLSTSSPAAYHAYYPSKYHGIKVIKYDIPSIRPQGPGDLWTCTFKACGHRVHEGSTANGIERIKAHFETHTHQAQEKIDLAYKESRPYLPVENLVRRIQALAPESGSATVRDKAGPPSPIKVRF
ncbi:hypothetical protein MMC07_006088 [Pseudocyphellaria aurata]|nr:hypothetical protein [Pseudocyphellaria aurata]